MKVTVTKELGEIYATPEQLAKMTDEAVVELIREDLYEFFEDATIVVERGISNWKPVDSIDAISAPIAKPSTFDATTRDTPLEAIGVSKRVRDYVTEVYAKDEVSLGKLIERMAAVYQIAKDNSEVTRAIGSALFSDSGCGLVE